MFKNIIEKVYTFDGLICKPSPEAVQIQLPIVIEEVNETAKAYKDNDIEELVDGVCDTMFTLIGLYRRAELKISSSGYVPNGFNEMCKALEEENVGRAFKAGLSWYTECLVKYKPLMLNYNLNTICDNNMTKYSEKPIESDEYECRTLSYNGKTFYGLFDQNGKLKKPPTWKPPILSYNKCSVTGILEL